MDEPKLRDKVVEIIRTKGHEVAVTGPLELIVNGRRFDLENLRRMVNHEPERGMEIIESHLDQLLTRR